MSTAEMSNIRPFATDGVPETNPFAYSCSFTFYTSYKIGMIGNGVGGMIGNGGGGMIGNGGGGGGGEGPLSKCSKTL